MYVCDVMVGGYLVHVKKPPSPHPPIHLISPTHHPTQPPSCGVEKRAYQLLTVISSLVSRPSHTSQYSTAQHSTATTALPSFHLCFFFYFFFYCFPAKRNIPFLFSVKEGYRGEGGYMPIVERTRTSFDLYMFRLLYVREVSYAGQGLGAYL